MTELVPAHRQGGNRAYHTYLAKLDAGDSRRTMKGCLDRMASMIAGRPVSGADLAWHKLTYEAVVALRELIVAQDWSPDHANKHIHALRRILEEAWKLKLMDAADYQRARSIEIVTGSRVPAGRHIADEEIDVALEACAEDPTHLGRRDAAMIGVLTCGLRRAEVAKLRVKDWDPISRKLLVRGKGNKHRPVPVPTWVAGLIEDWLSVRSREDGALFVAVGRYRMVTASTALAKHMTGQAIADVVTARMPTKARCHDFRRTVVGNLIETADISTAALYVGHAKITTTARYDMRPEERMREAIDNLARRKELV